MSVTAALVALTQSQKAQPRTKTLTSYQTPLLNGSWFKKVWLCFCCRFCRLTEEMPWLHIKFKHSPTLLSTTGGKQPFMCDHSACTWIITAVRTSQMSNFSDFVCFSYPLTLSHLNTTGDVAICHLTIFSIILASPVKTRQKVSKSLYKMIFTVWNHNQSLYLGCFCSFYNNS